MIQHVIRLADLQRKDYKFIIGDYSTISISINQFVLLVFELLMILKAGMTR